ncbi:hypothetical protein T492DRAFT_1103284 [Pavlovales sp. CCMP2436]|nr:hypothetical protein T492DRAFT_1103284 [Pavlovales sp. CCMP2436]
MAAARLVATHAATLRSRYEAACLAHAEVEVLNEAKAHELQALRLQHDAVLKAHGALTADEHQLASAQMEWQGALDAEVSALSQSRLATLELDRQIVSLRQDVDKSRREASAARAHNVKLTRHLEEHRRKLDRLSIVRSSANQTHQERQTSVAELRVQLAQEQAHVASLLNDQEQLDAATEEWRRYISAEMATRADAARAEAGGAAENSFTQQQRRALDDSRGMSASLRRQNANARGQITELQRRAEQPPTSANRRSPSAARSVQRLPLGQGHDLDELREEQALLEQREAQWLEYCRAIGKAPNLVAEHYAHTRSQPDGRHLDRDELQRQNDQIRERIAQLQLRAY